MPALRGLEQSQEQDSGLLLRDTRTMEQRVRDFFKDPTYAAMLLLGCAIGTIFLPALSDLIFLIGVGCFLYAYTRRRTLPFRLPQRSQQLDYNDPKAGSNKPQQARGICFIGNDKKTSEELWLTNEDMRTHVLMFGSTGSGKTEALISLAFNSLVQGSGFIYVDGKGDNSLFAKIFSMARKMGREDDVLLINFMTGAKDIVGPQEKRLSNTMNPFSNGSSSMLSQLVVSLMDASSNTPDGDMWKGRAIVFVEALMKLLVYMRDKGAILLDANTIRNYFDLGKLESIVVDRQFPRDGQESVSLADTPPVVMEPLENYVSNLPGYDRSKKGKQVSQVLEQHGFITMQLVRVFGSLADTYGHILRTNLAEVDLKDVVLNRRILVVLLPAFEKSPDELSNLGKVIVASLKSMLAAGLGEEVEGEYHDIIQRKPTNSLTPYLCVLDEYGYYSVPGFAVVPAQARSLGFSIIFAGQDLPSFQKASKEEAMSIGANTNIKICMKLEDPLETWEFFSKTAGESYVTKVESFQTRPETIMNMYADSRSSTVEKRARVDLLDLKEQREGEAHIFFKSKIIRAKMFYADPKPVKRMKVNQFLKVDYPKSRLLADMDRRLASFQKSLEKEHFFDQVQIEQDDLTTISNLLSENTYPDAIENGVMALINFHNQTQAPDQTMPLIEEETSAGEINIFAKLNLDDTMRANLLTDDVEGFAAPLLSAGWLRNQVAAIERMIGKQKGQAGEVANSLVTDVRNTTHYPPLVLDVPNSAALADVLKELSERFRSERARKALEQSGNPS